jgi:AMP-activated protein kinase-like protein
VSSRQGWTREAQGYMDGERPGPGISSEERATADRLRRAVTAYAASLRAPTAELDDRIMARVRERERSQGHQSMWRWFVASHSVRVRPLVLALAASMAFLVWWRGQPDQTVPPPISSPATVLVRFELLAPRASSVALAGSFNDWSSEGLPLAHSAAQGLWTVTVPLPVGEHEYLFVVDGAKWMADPTAQAQVDDGFGQTNSVIVVGPRGVVRS